MPRPRARVIFELDGQWIAEEPGRPGLYRFWNDPGTGRTRRASLRTTDPELAKTRLAEIVVKGAPATVDTYVSIVLEKYFAEKTDHLPSKKPARHAGRLMLRCHGAMVKVGALTEEQQKKFVRWSFDQGHALSYIARNLGVVAAAFEHSKLAHTIIYNEGAILAKWPEFKPKPAREIYEPTDEELARLLRAKIPEDLRRWLLNSMATGGRPEAVLNLSPAQRVRDLGLIDLNPPSRRQNKKHRPTVRELRCQTRWLDKWERKGLALHAHRYCGYASVDSIDTALRRWRDKAAVNVPLISVYSIRHRVASVLRASKKPRVPGEQVSYQLGHKRMGTKGEARTTRRYGEFGPEYLAEAAQALEAWVIRVLALSARKSHGIPAKVRGRIRKAA